MDPPSLLLVSCCFGWFVCSPTFFCPPLFLQADSLCHLPNFISLKSTYSVYVLSFITGVYVGLCLLFSYHEGRLNAMWSTDRPWQHQIHQMQHPERRPDLPFADMLLQQTELARGLRDCSTFYGILYILDHWWHAEEGVCENILLCLVLEFPEWSVGLPLLF